MLRRHHRTGEAACVRATGLQMPPMRIDQGIDVFKMASLPAIDQLLGFCSASLLANRTAGRAVSSVTYDSFAAIEQTPDLAATIRAADTQDAGAEVIEVAEFELARAHVRVPEMA